MKRVAFYGGSFNPPHASHQATVLYALEHANVDRVVVAPAFSHPHGKKLASFNHRMAMCHWMVQPFHVQDVQVSNIEERVYNQHGNGFTCNTVKMLRDTQLIDTVVLVLGSDIKSAYPTWEGRERLDEMVAAGTLELFWVSRVDGVSSTDVRERIAAGKPIDRLVPRSVCDYIEDQGLYINRIVSP